MKFDEFFAEFLYQAVNRTPHSFRRSEALDLIGCYLNEMNCGVFFSF